MGTYSPATSEVDSSNHRIYVGKLVLSYQLGWEFTLQNLDQLYVLVTSAQKTTCHDMTYTVLKVTKSKLRNN